MRIKTKMENSQGLRCRMWLLLKKVAKRFYLSAETGDQKIKPNKNDSTSFTMVMSLVLVSIVLVLFILWALLQNLVLLS